MTRWCPDSSESQAHASERGAAEERMPEEQMAEERTIIRSVMVVCGMRISISRTRRRDSFSAELVFEGGGESDRAVVDAGSAEELEWLIEAVAYPAALARRASSSSSLGGAGPERSERLRGLT